MKEKIKAALQQQYPQLGLDDETFEGVAAAAETLIKDEASIPNFVKGAEAMLKRYQSIADKARGEAAAAKKELEDLKAATAKAEPKPEPDKPGTKTEPKPDEPKPEPKSDIDYAKLVAEAVTAAIKPLQDKIDAFENAEKSKGAIKEGKDKFFANKIAPEYAAERDEAWDRVLEYNELKGNKMTGEELAARAKEYFEKSVSRKGVDNKKAYDNAGAPKPSYDSDKKLAEKMRGGAAKQEPNVKKD